jgi:RHS repeat-associated protein
LNGNLQTLKRYGNTGSVTDGTALLHNFIYEYLANTNKLTRVNNAATTYGTYQYNALGQLKQDELNGQIRKYSYEVSGKMRTLQDNAGVVQAEFFYDASGQRLRKWSKSGGNTNESIPACPAGRYVRDNAGNVLAIYSRTNNAAFAQVEVPIYGSGRIGNYKVAANTYVYEHKDHLGNVRAVFAAKADGSLDVLTATDYYTLGSVSKQNGVPYRYGYQGNYAEKDNETGYNFFELRNYDALIGRWTTTDPKQTGWSPYWGMGNDWSNKTDPDGGSEESTIVTKNLNGTFTVKSVNPFDGDNGIYLDNNGAKGELIGYSATPFSFYNSDGDGIAMVGAVINPSDQSGRNFLNKLLASKESEVTYGSKAHGGQEYDFKRTNGTKEDLYPTIDKGHFRGMPIMDKVNGLPIYASARDIGNIGAGLILGRSGTSWDAGRLALDALESIQKGGFATETDGTKYAERLGWNVGIALYNKMGLSRLPSYGEYMHLKIPKGYIGLGYKQK